MFYVSKKSNVNARNRTSVGGTFLIFEDKVYLKKSALEEGQVLRKSHFNFISLLPSVFRQQEKEREKKKISETNVNHELISGGKKIQITSRRRLTSNFCRSLS